MTSIASTASLRDLRRGDITVRELRDSLHAMTDAELAAMGHALAAAPDLHHGNRGAAVLRSLLLTVGHIQRWRGIQSTLARCQVA
jgi:hypothetical protein